MLGTLCFWTCKIWDCGIAQVVGFSSGDGGACPRSIWLMACAIFFFTISMRRFARSEFAREFWRGDDEACRDIEVAAMAVCCCLSSTEVELGQNWDSPSCFRCWPTPGTGCSSECSLLCFRVFALRLKGRRTENRSILHWVSILANNWKGFLSTYYFFYYRVQSYEISKFYS